MKKCHIPPKGWVCSREQGHEGPCAADEAEPTASQLADDFADRMIQNLRRNVARDKASRTPPSDLFSEGYAKGVNDALSALTFEEANTSGFDSPYTSVYDYRQRRGPISRLHELRKKRLLGG